MNTAELTALVAALADVRLDGGCDAFELSKSLLPFTHRNRTLASRQERVLEVVQSIRPPPLLVIPDDPIACRAPGTWVAEGEAWRLPTHAPAERLLDEFLYVGNWLLYAGPSGLPLPGLDVHRTPPAEVLAFMHRHALWLLIDAWHDGTSWQVYVSGR